VEPAVPSALQTYTVSKQDVTNTSALVFRGFWKVFYDIAFSLFLLFRNKIVLAMKTRGESGVKAPLILKLCGSWR
jgi:hypothetical protein